MYLKIGDIQFEIITDSVDCINFFNQSRFKSFHVPIDKNDRIFKFRLFTLNKYNKKAIIENQDLSTAHSILTNVCTDTTINNDLFKIVPHEMKMHLLQENSKNSSKCYVNKKGILLYVFNGAFGAFNFIEGEATLFWNPKFIKMEGALNRLFYDFFTGSLIHHKEDKLFFHSSGAIINNHGYLFCAKSGGGKTTISNLIGKDKILSDERVLVEWKKDGVYLTGTPWNGREDKIEPKADSVKLKRICLLKKSQKIYLSPSSLLDQAKYLYPCLTNYGYVKKYYASRQMSLLHKLSAEVDINLLGFRIDSNLNTLKSIL